MSASDAAPSAQDLQLQGHALLAKQDFGAAAECFAQAVEALNAQYGEMALETVDALIAYGKALLRHAVASSGVFGSSSANNPPTDAAAEPSTSKLPQDLPAPDAKKFHFSGDESEGDEPEDQEDEEPKDEEDAAPDPTDDLGDAYEVLDMARAILSKLPNTDKDAMIKLAGVHAALGEVATESEKFKDAADEYASAIAVLEPVLPPHARKFAEMHMMAALSWEYIPQTATELAGATGKEARDKAVHHAELAKKVLLLRKAHVEEQELEGDQVTKQGLEELEDISLVLADLEEKIEELKQMPEVAALTERDKKVDAALAAPALPADAPKNDLTTMGLVKKKPKAAPAAPLPPKTDAVAAPSSEKRKAEDEPEATSKKARVEDVKE